MMNSN